MCVYLFQSLLGFLLGLHSCILHYHSPYEGFFLCDDLTNNVRGKFLYTTSTQRKLRHKNDSNLNIGFSTACHGKARQPRGHEEQSPHAVWMLVGRQRTMADVCAFPHQGLESADRLHTHARANVYYYCLLLLLLLLFAIRAPGRRSRQSVSHIRYWQRPYLESYQILAATLPGGIKPSSTARIAATGSYNSGGKYVFMHTYIVGISRQL